MAQTPRSIAAEAHRLCRSVIDALSDSILILDVRTSRILDANNCAIKTYGYSRAELIGKELKELTNHVVNYSELGCGRSVEQTHFNKAGEKIPFLVSMCPIDYWGRNAVVSIHHNIHQRKRIEAAITASEKQMRSLVESISEIVVLIDAEGAIKFVSPQVERVLSYPVSEVKGKNIFDFVHPDDRERVMAEYSKTLSEPGEAVPSTLRVRTLGGEWVPFEIIANNQLDDPEVAAVVFTARDLRYRREAERAVRAANADFERRVEERTMELAKANAALRIENQQRRHTEAQLQQSLSVLHSTLESTADGILVIGKDSRITSCNQKFMDMWNIPQMAMRGLGSADLLAMVTPQLQDTQEFLAELAKLRSEKDAVTFTTVKLKTGRIFEIYSQPQRVRDDIVGRVWSFRDVTHTRQIEDELRQSQKMEAIGRLAGGVAHDFNNMLMLISGYAGQLLDDTRLPARNRAIAQQLLEATKRAAALTRQLLAFSRKQPLTPRLLDLNRIVSDMQRMLERLLSDRVQLVINLQKDPVLIRADHSQIELMIMNLAINARDAMPEGGFLTMRTSTLTLSEEDTSARTAVQYAMLEVSDTGHGMSEEIRKHIFEPFFTTKEAGRGSGLGLSTVYGIVEAAGGHISVESEPEQGATFRVYLPQASGMLSEEPKVLQVAPVGGNETILLVEDEAGIRTMTKVYLETLGYAVLEADSPHESERIAREHRGAIDLVITDIIMPGKRGDQMIREIRKKRPETAAVFISGFADVQDLDPSIPVLEKPFAFPELGLRVREVLDQAKSERQGRAEDKGVTRKRA
ncbi:MAG TPA: PAS domain S-box protein [Candidatus Angelobacter sp.]|nr:PAS domain S-box protein [Candidatus Angelobacter sp.]